MSGELLLENRIGKYDILALAGTAALVGAVMFLISPLVPLSEPVARGAVIALATYVLFRVCYPFLRGRFHNSGAQSVHWELSGDALALGERIIPRSAIRNVYVWPNRNALGQTRPGLVVNIETDGKNELLRSLTRGDEIEVSVERLKELARALGRPIE